MTNFQKQIFKSLPGIAHKTREEVKPLIEQGEFTKVTNILARWSQWDEMTRQVYNLPPDRNAWAAALDDNPQYYS